MKTKGYLLIILFMAFVENVWCISAEKSLDFEQLTPSQGLSHPTIYSILQDHNGYMWFGSKEGLDRYDGYAFRSYRYDKNASGCISNSRVNCIEQGQGDTLYIGTDNGLNIYSAHTDRFTMVEFTRGYSIKFVKSDSSGRLWIGTNRGLINYNLLSHVSHLFDSESSEGFPGDYITCCLQKDSLFYVGTHGAFSVFSHRRDFVNYELPFARRYPENLVLSMIDTYDDSSLIWLGTENGLILYDTVSKKSKLDNLLFENIPVKSLHYDSLNNLWIGTDFGLYVMDARHQISQYLHDSMNARSLTNNAIWSIYSDSNDNIWLGTENGISVYHRQNNYQRISIQSITGQNQGNQIMSICSDDRSNLWLGGTNGLIRYNQQTGEWVWYKSQETGKKHISHNKIRNLRYDGQSLWIATDNGLNRYDYKTDNIYHYDITEPTGRFNSHWMYSIVEDNEHNLWLGTYEGGIFMLSKEKILKSGTSPIEADYHYSTQNRLTTLSSNIINSLVIDDKGDLWAASDDRGLMYLSAHSVNSRSYSVANSPLLSDYVKCMVASAAGGIWIGTDNGLNYISENGVFSSIPLLRESSSIRFVVPQGKNVWLNSDCGVGCYDPQSQYIKHFYMGDDYYQCGFYCENDNQMYLGATDAFIKFNPDSLNSADMRRKVSVTKILLANHEIEPGVKYGGNMILKNPLPYQEEISLRSNQNSFALEFSSFLFYQSNSIRYRYRLRGFDDNWSEISGMQHRVSFINIPSGEYVFEVCAVNSEGARLNSVSSLPVNIQYPWYRTVYAEIVYVLFCLILIFLIWRWLTTRHQLVIERVTRDKTMKLAKMKMDFYANVSHDFKTPLSLIIGQVGQMVLRERSTAQKRALLSIQQNAQKIHLLINQMLDSNSEKDGDLIISETPVQEYLENIFNSFEAEFERRNIRHAFTAQIGDRYTFHIDQVRLESVFNNIISNSLKFTEDGGEISMDISIVEDNEPMVKIVITDTGVGIDKNDVTKVFERYYKGADPKGLNVNGTGIGLSMVRQIVTLHKGRVMIESEQGVGTKVAVMLPVSRFSSLMVSNDGTQDIVYSHESPFGTQKPKLLVVEDNAEMCDMICSTLSHTFSVLGAFDGDEAYEIAKEEKPELVLTDLMIPGMDGVELCRHLKDNLSTAFIPVIILTAKGDEETERTALDANVDMFMTKPFDMAILLENIERLILNSRRLEDKKRQQQIMKPAAEELESPDEKFLYQITELIENSISDPDLNVTTLCEKTGVNSKQVYRKIKLLTDMTVVEYIRNIRIKKAALYLRQQKLSVSEVMYMVGFSNHSYFTKCFKEEYKVSPKEYAAQFKEKK